MVRHLTETARPAVVITGNGVCGSGRIVNFLKTMLYDPRHNVLFVGYHAERDSGRAIQAYGPRGDYADLVGQRYDIGVRIDNMGSYAAYAAYADQEGLVNFVTRMRE